MPIGAEEGPCTSQIRACVSGHLQSVALPSEPSEIYLSTSVAVVYKQPLALALMCSRSIKSSRDARTASRCRRTSKGADTLPCPDLVRAAVCCSLTEICVEERLEWKARERGEQTPHVCSAK